MSLTIATIGNPNSGKTTLFNALTGSHQRVGNWSGVTVDKKTGTFRLNHDRQATLIDLPGIYNLDFDVQGSSVDERIAFDYVMHNKPDIILNVIDASCLERSLYLTLQLRELGLPVVAILNKVDVAKNKKLCINPRRLATQLGCPLFMLSAHDKSAVQQLVSELDKFHTQLEKYTPLHLHYGDRLESVINELEDTLENNDSALCKRALAIKLLEKDSSLKSQIKDEKQHRVTQILLDLNMDVDLQIAETRYSFIYQVTQQSVRIEGHLGRSITDKIDAITLNKYLGIPFFLFVMYLMFMFSINIGSAFIDFFDIFSGAIFVDGFALVLSALAAPDWLINVLAFGMGNGIQTVLTFIPIIACLYLFLAILESSGYLARAAFVIDRFMQYLGLPGKSFVPMIIGFGCTVPAVMATRTLEKERERLLTVVMSPFMSCGARLPVYALFSSAFFPKNGQNVVFALYFIGILVAVLTGIVLSRTVLPGKNENMFLELPDYEFPTLKNTLIKTWHKLKGFLFGAGKIIVLVVTLLNVLNSVSLDGSFGHQNSQDSVLSKGAQFITPILSPLGVQINNWPATVGIVTGLFAKEAVVGTLNNLYSTAFMQKDVSFSLLDKFNEALQTIPKNLFGISIVDPLGLNIGNIENLDVAAAEQGVDLSIYKNIQKAFVTQEAAFAYLLFILLYAPCAAAMGAIVREVGGNWAKFIALWTTLSAYVVSVLYYQIATFMLHPKVSLIYISCAVIIVFSVLYLLKRRGNILFRDVYL